MKTQIASLITILLINFTSCFAFAARTTTNPGSGDEFQKSISLLQGSALGPCPRTLCSNKNLDLRTLLPLEAAQLDSRVRGALVSAMNSIADIWPDTILEGGFETNFKLRLDQVQLVYIKNRMVGYRITFSSEAWDEDHNAGRIVEHGFVSADLKNDFRDEAELAEFQPSAR